MTDNSPRSSRTRMTGAQRREQLLDIGRRLFAKRGFDGTSIEEIAGQAGVSKPVVYEHFGGKEGLYAVVVDREMQTLLTMVQQMTEGENSREKYEDAAVALLKYIEDNADGFRILVRDSDAAGGTGTFGSLLADIASQVEYILADVFRARGLDPKHAPMYAQMLTGMVAFTGQWWLDARKPKVEEVAAHLINLAWNGLAALDPKPKLSVREARRHGAREAGDNPGAASAPQVSGSRNSAHQDSPEQQSMGQHSMGQDSLGQDSLEQDSLERNRAPENGITENGAPQNGVPHDGAPRGGRSPDGGPRAGTSQPD